MAPPPSVNLEFYYGTAIPAIACTDPACTVILDDGTGFADGRDAGLSYGWNCDGDPNVDYSGGRRGLVSESDELFIKNEDFCIKNEELCIKNEDFCIKNEELCIKNEELCI